MAAPLKMAPPRQPDDFEAERSPWQLYDVLAEAKPTPPVRPPRLQGWLTGLGALLAATIGWDEVIIGLGLLLLARGCYLLLPAAGWIAPGIILIWLALPQRPRFLAPKPPSVVNITQPPTVPPPVRPGGVNGAP